MEKRKRGWNKWNKWCAILISAILVMMSTMTSAAGIQSVNTSALQQLEVAGNEQYKIVIDQDTITIDGKKITRQEFIEALSKAKRVAPPKENQTVSEGEAAVKSCSSMSAASGGVLYELGIGITSVFQKIAYALSLSSCVGTCWTIVIDGMEIGLVVVGEGILIAGVLVGFCWATYEIVQHCEKHISDPIEETTTKEEVETGSEGKTETGGETGEGNEGDSDSKLPNQGTVKGDVEGAPSVDAGKQGKHVEGHPNYKSGSSTWQPGNNGVHDTQEGWLNGKELPDGTKVWATGKTTGTNGETGVRVHIDGKGNIHGYPVDPGRYLPGN